MTVHEGSQGLAVNRAAVDREQWTKARAAHLEAEKAFTRQRDELSRQRRELPWLEITDEYQFDGADGQRSLIDLFDGRDQLLIYHFMFGPGWEEGCPSCSFWADSFNGTEAHLAARNTTLATVSRAPFAELDQYRTRMGWTFPWYSSAGSSFNYDMAVSFTQEQLDSGEPVYNFDNNMPPGEEGAGISVFARGTDGGVYLTYQTFARGLDMLNGSYHMLDLVPKGRDEDDLPFTMAWLQRHDRYQT